MTVRSRIEKLERVIAPSLPPTLSEADKEALDQDRRAWWESMLQGLAIGAGLWGHHGVPAVKRFIEKDLALLQRVKLTSEELERLAEAVDAQRAELEKETHQPTGATDLGLEDLEPWSEPDDDGNGDGEEEYEQILSNLTPR